MNTRIALIHNIFLAKKGLEMLVRQNSDFELVCSGSRIEEIDTDRGSEVDVVIFNFKDQETGLQCMSQYRSMFPKASFLSVSSMPNRSDISEALKSEVTSFLLTECEEDEIEDAIRSTHANEQFFCGKILSQVVQNPDEALPASEFVCDGIRISQRESEIIRLVAEGLTNKEIADKLFISAHTVTTHRKNIMAKLGVNNTAGLMMFAIRNNIVTPNHFLFNSN